MKKEIIQKTLAWKKQWKTLNFEVSDMNVWTLCFNIC